MDGWIVTEGVAQDNDANPKTGGYWSSKQEIEENKYVRQNKKTIQKLQLKHNLTHIYMYKYPRRDPWTSWMICESRIIFI